MKVVVIGGDHGVAENLGGSYPKRVPAIVDGEVTRWATKFGLRTRDVRVHLLLHEDGGVTWDKDGFEGLNGLA